MPELISTKKRAFDLTVCPACCCIQESPRDGKYLTQCTHPNCNNYVEWEGNNARWHYLDKEIEYDDILKHYTAVIYVTKLLKEKGDSQDFIIIEKNRMIEIHRV